ncbi:MAG TPA: TlpA disulfide reductase family protein [Chloroflexota bacterium]
MNGLWIAAFGALWLVVIALCVVVMGLLRQLGMIQLRFGIDPGVLITKEGLERGTEAPDFEAIDQLTLKRVSLRQHRGKRVMLVFLSTGCLACRRLVPHLNAMARDRQGEVHFLAVCHGHETGCREFARTYKLDVSMLTDPTDVIAASYGIDVTPFAFLIDERGFVLLRGIANSWPQLESLLREEGTIQTHAGEIVDDGELEFAGSGAGRDGL